MVAVRNLPRSRLVLTVRVASPNRIGGVAAGPCLSSRKFFSGLGPPGMNRQLADFHSQCRSSRRAGHVTASESRSI